MAKAKQQDQQEPQEPHPAIERAVAFVHHYKHLGVPEDAGAHIVAIGLLLVARLEQTIQLLDDMYQTIELAAQDILDQMQECVDKGVQELSDVAGIVVPPEKTPPKKRGRPKKAG